MKYATVILFLVGCFLISGCGKEPYTPPVEVSLIAVNHITTYRIQNNLDRPVFLQLQTGSAVGYYLQRRQMPGTGELELEIPAGQNLGIQATRLDAGKTIEFDVTYQPPISFRIGIVYSLYSDTDSDQWHLCWSGWYDWITDSEPAAALQRDKPSA